MAEGLGALFTQKFKSAVSIVLPAMNESENVLPLVGRIAHALKEHVVEIFYIDDSRDTKTVEQVAEAQELYGSENLRVRIFHRLGEDRWGGLSGAVSDGLQQATHDQVVVMDADLQHPPELLPDMIEEGEHHDVVVASRYCEGGSAGGLDGSTRHLVSRSSTWLAKLLFPSRLRGISDPMTGYFMLDRTQIDVKKLRPKGYKILLEILGTHPELTRVEVPLEFAERNAGESKASMKNGIAFLTQLLQLKALELLRFFTMLPKIIQFGAIGGGVFAVGMALLAVLVEVFHLSPLFANAVQLVVTFAMNYELNRRLTWGERSITNRAAHKFVISRTATTILNYYLFILLFERTVRLQLVDQNISISIGYFVANVIALVIITAINFVVSDRWAFAENTIAEVEAVEDMQAGVMKETTDGKLHFELDLSNAVRPVPSYIEELYSPLHATSPSVQSSKKSTLQLLRRFNLYAFLLLCTGAVVVGMFVSVAMTIAFLLTLAGLFLFIQSSVEVWRILYTYRHPEAVDRLKFPELESANERFCLIVPARHESEVLSITLKQLAKQSHQNMHIITVICSDDTETMRVAYETALQDRRITVMQYPLGANEKPSKPKQLNHVYQHIKDQDYTVVGIIDAEDTVHPGLLNKIDAAFADTSVGVVQGGVQLMNHDSSWYALHNVLEYYRWFNSAMAFQAAHNFMPLGGNTIFIRNDLLKKAGGWPETLTEDCSLGVLLSTRYNAKTAVYYEPELATREETPDSLKGLFKQRVRWNQGFFHEWLLGIWRELPTFKQRLLANYVLMSPIILGAISVLMFVSLLAAIFLDAPVGLVMLMYLSLIPGILLIILNLVFLYDFGRAFSRKVTMKHYSLILLTSVFYQIVLNAAAFWAIIRQLRGDQSWHKTSHSGLHRQSMPSMDPMRVAAFDGGAE